MVGTIHAYERVRDLNTRTIREFIDLIEDYSEDRTITFLRKAGHRIDGYITQQIGPYPGEPDLLLQNI
ncbi:unnamed protein product [Macrosiphum euphorbiae]|uniref:Uncharacterized protein n=1 Tax=Macrosiphum euphorbiae TaxID=13131 RepID=A0AAV0WFU4_9HEMI|nr:unnamed protein product [Macrosiphum euphorbiae]